MINRETGAISIDGLGDFIGPTLTKSDFESSSLGKSSESGGSNGGWSRFYFNASMSSKVFAFGLYFFHEQLATVTFAPFLEGRTWAMWSEEGEKEIAKEYARFLIVELGNPPHDFRWGAASSGNDPKTGDAYLTLRYRDSTTRSFVGR